MKAALRFLFVMVPALAGADTIYKCEDNGKAVFTATPTGPSCQPMGLKVIEADPKEAARLRRETELWNEQRREMVQDSLAREAKATQQRRKAELDAVKTNPRRSTKGGQWQSGLGADPGPEKATVPIAPDTASSGSGTNRGSAGGR
ncbi:hypothetical protein SAMN02949497_1764 [Methylomagnum ishizawai]|uniref:DUF4124 domain-containing protein n=1 Tax=Methylomagnum ishizawai TaxID=1760988 RepID=A0A1Y6CUY6_9GAMM|nr:DUF4124 domain-containing protein [Methylomagnum ishizawai]SMF94448.1 hypothetical protein SAMN02949497_1764 [Methylomagnum ishizawai]